LGEWTVPIREITIIYTPQYAKDLKNKNRQTSQVQQISTLPDHVIPCLVTAFGIIPKENNEQGTQQSLLQEITQTNLILPDSIILVTDASVQQGTSAIAWVISDTNGNILQKKSQWLEAVNMSSFRAEAYGVYLVLQRVYQEIQQHNVQSILYCDNKALIHRLNKIQQTPVNMEWMDSNVLQRISQFIPINGYFQHVKGDQQVTEGSKIQVKLNAHVDKLARDSLMDQPQHIPMAWTISIYGNEKQMFGVPSIIQHCWVKISQEHRQSKLGEDIYKQITQLIH
jgi:Reverse transcriptase-like